MLDVSLAGKVLFEAGELAHPFLVLQKVGEVCENLSGVTHTLSGAQDIKEIDRFEQHEVRKGDFIAAQEILALKAFDDGRVSCFSSSIIFHLISLLNSWHNNLVDEGVID